MHTNGTRLLFFFLTGLQDFYHLFSILLSCQNSAQQNDAADDAEMLADAAGRRID